MNPTSPITNLSHLNFTHTHALQLNEQPIQYRSYKTIDVDNFKNDILTSPLYTNPASNASDLADQLSSTLKSILDIHAPIKSKTVVQRPHTPWINPEILQAKRERSRLERCWRRWKSPFDRMKFRAQCNSVRSLISKAKSSFLSNLVTESSDNPRTLWKTLNTILHRNPSNSLPESPDAPSLANTFLDFFKDKIERIRTKFLPSDSPDPFLFPPAPPPKADQFYSSHAHWNSQTQFLLLKINNVYLIPFQLSFWNSASMNLVQSSQILSISLFLKEFFHRHLNKLLSSLFSKNHLYPLMISTTFVQSLTSTSFPKFSKKLLPPAFNLICLLTLCLLLFNLLTGSSIQLKLLFSKFTMTSSLRWIVVRSLHSFFLTYLLLSTLSIIPSFSLVFKIGLVLMVFLLLGSHPISHLALRQSQSMIPSLHSLLFPVVYPKVPYLAHYFLLSILLLFARWSQKIPSNIICMLMTPSCTSLSLLQILLYLLTHLPTTFNDILSWMNLNKLLLNPSKTEFLLIGTKQQRLKFSDLTNLSLSNDIIPVSSSARNLGFIFDSDMSLSDQIKSVSKSCHFHIRDIRRIRHLLPLSAATALANSLVSSKLDYCNSLYSGISQVNLNKLSTHSKLIGTRHHKHLKIPTHHTNTQKTTLASNQTKNWLQTLSSHIQNTYKSTTNISLQ